MNVNSVEQCLDSELHFQVPWSAASERAGLGAAGPPDRPAVSVCRLAPRSAVAGGLPMHCPGLSPLLTATLASGPAGGSINN